MLVFGTVPRIKNATFGSDQAPFLEQGTINLLSREVNTRLRSAEKMQSGCKHGTSYRTTNQDVTVLCGDLRRVASQELTQLFLGKCISLTH